MRRLSAAFVALLAFCAAPAALAAGLRLSVGPVPTIYSGTTYYISAGIEKEDRNDGIVHHAPFTFRTTLPPGVEYTGFNGGWTCSTPPGNLRDVTCVYLTDLNFFIPGSSYLQINANVAANVTPGPVNVVATLESSEVPLPQNPVCGASPSVTGCATVVTNYVQSQLRISDWGYNNGTVTNGPVAVWTGGPFEAGTTQNIVVLNLANLGYGPTNTPVTVNVDLPAGLTFSSGAGSPPFTCATQTPVTRVRCTTPYLIDYGFISLRLDVAPNVAVPGPLYVHASVANNVQAAPADCVTTPLQTGCGRLQIPTRAPRVPTLVGDSITHSPATFTLGQEAGPVIVSYRNIGEGNAGAPALRPDERLETIAEDTFVAMLQRAREEGRDRVAGTERLRRIGDAGLQDGRRRRIRQIERSDHGQWSRRSGLGMRQQTQTDPAQPSAEQTAGLTYHDSPGRDLAL